MEKRELTVRDILECTACYSHVANTPGLVMACASVGIEHGKSTSKLLLQYLATFHLRGHENWKED